MPFVEHVHNGHHIHACAAAVGGIYIVAQGNKADAVRGENIVDILPDLYVISSEPRKIFDDDRIQIAVFRVV